MAIEQKLDFLIEKVVSIDERLGAIEQRMDNELKVDIQRVAEGHLDLNSKLENALKPSAELEMLSIKVRVLESEVDEMKWKIS